MRSATSNAAKTRDATFKRIQALGGNVVVAQMLPDSAAKGGTGLKLRFGDRVTRETPDLDTAFRGDREAFVAEPGSKRAHDLVDLQLIVPRVDLQRVRETTERLFRFRDQHRWPPLLTAGAGRQELYDSAAVGLDVLSLDAAVVWINDYIRELSTRS